MTHVHIYKPLLNPAVLLIPCHAAYIDLYIYYSKEEKGTLFFHTTVGRDLLDFGGHEKMTAKEGWCQNLSQLDGAGSWKKDSDRGVCQNVWQQTEAGKNDTVLLKIVTCIGLG